MIHKTNAVRLLDQMKIHYELREYDAGSEDLSDFSAEAGCRENQPAAWTAL